MTTTEPRGLIGARTPRIQDDRLLRGHGRYVDDLTDRATLHAAFVRAQTPSGQVTAFDAAEALALEGVQLVLGPAELAQKLAPLPHPWLIPGQQIAEVVLAETTIRYVGQPLAVVVATSRAVAEDGAELVEIDVEERDAVVGVTGARCENGPLVYPEFGSNQVGTAHLGDPVEDLDECFARAATVVEATFDIPRIAHSPMETRGFVVEYIASTGHLEIVASCHVPHLIRQEVAHTLGMRVDRVRVVAHDVGGSFGQKSSLLPDEAMVCAAARTLGTRVKWIEDRSESLVAPLQGRGQQCRGRLALDAHGRFLAIHADVHGDIGAFPATGGGANGPFEIAGMTIEGPYRFERAGATVTTWYTNAAPTGAFRGYGMPEACFVRERLVDEAARQLATDPQELRLLNMLRAEDLPFFTRTQMAYDNGNYPLALSRAAEYGRTRARASENRIRRGIGFASMTEITGYAPTALHEMLNIQWSGYDSTRIRVNEDGTVTVHSGVTGVGQGIETSLAQIAAERLGVPLDWIAVDLGDSAVSPYSNIGSQASRGLPIGGGALWEAADRLRLRMRALAASYLKVPVPDDVTYRDGIFHAPDGGTATWREIAHRGWMGWGRDPKGPIALEEIEEFDPPSITYGYATHGTQVAVDLDTGKILIEDYWLTHDAGVVVNPLIAEGQITGGVAMGIGSTLLEEVAFSAEGQPLATTYLDYLLPMSEDVPDIVQDHLEIPSEIIPGGFKGLGESGTIPVSAAIANAVAAAVPEIADKLVAIPLSPSRVWTMLDEAGLTR